MFNLLVRSIINSDFQPFIVLIYVIYEALRIKQVINKHISFTNLLIQLPSDDRFLTKQYCIKERDRQFWSMEEHSNKL